MKATKTQVQSFVNTGGGDPELAPKATFRVAGTHRSSTYTCLTSSRGTVRMNRADQQKGCERGIVVVFGGFGFHHIRTVFGFFRVGSSVSTKLDSEREILGPLGRVGF